jgi:hypothetical protein
LYPLSIDLSILSDEIIIIRVISLRNDGNTKHRTIHFE